MLGKRYTFAITSLCNQLHFYTYTSLRQKSVFIY
uniref:Uncharacterized protein n=1 Tax=Rhizophora mucronata TaxID=61149 RepID=A0A2P2PHT6_RHIMU